MMYRILNKFKGNVIYSLFHLSERRLRYCDIGTLTGIVNYNHKWNRDYPTDDYIIQRRYQLPTRKKLSILIINKEYGRFKITGELSQERVLVNQLMEDIRVFVHLLIVII